MFVVTSVFPSLKTYQPLTFDIRIKERGGKRSQAVDCIASIWNRNEFIFIVIVGMKRCGFLRIPSFDYENE